MLTVQEMADLTLEKGIELVGGKKGLNRKIEYINVQEIAGKSTWMKHNGFILTTFNDFKDKDTILDQVKWYKEKRVSAIGFHLAVHTDIPKEVINLANDIALPIFKIPSHVPYYYIFERVNEKIYKQSETLKEQINKVNEGMLNAVLLEKESFHIVHKMGEFLQTPIILLSSSLEMNAMWSNPAFSRRLLYDVVQEMIKTEAGTFKNCKYHNHIAYSKDYKIGDKKLPFSIFPLRNGLDFFGYLIVAMPNHNFTNYELVINHGITALKLDGMKKNATKQFFKSQDTKLFESIFQGGEKEDISPARFNFPVHTINQLFIAETSEVASIKEHYLNIEACVVEHSQHYFLWINNNQIYGLLSDKAAESLKMNLKGQCKDLAIGFSGLLPSFTGEKLEKIHKEAESSLKFAKRNNKSLVMWEDLKFDKIIYSLDDDQHLYNYDQELLVPLIEYDCEKGTNLVNTLYVYLSCFFSLKESSRQLYVHPNTVKYRLDKVKELLPNIDMQHPDTYMELMFALKLFNYKNNSL
ncbi:PucR family transcriptional regulator [Halobacillus andaensis]|uniref:PucR family transcriptional regulator n=1 Tax=Halobacillus andaensis TaxID=1176239 RepID=UPI003D73ABCC